MNKMTMTSPLSDNSPAIQPDITIEDDLWLNQDCDYAGIAAQCLSAAMNILSDHQITNLPAPCVSIVLTNDAEIKELNKNYRNKDKPTNVLSFPAIDFNADNDEIIQPALPETELGDIILAYETIAREADEQNKSLSNHFKHLIVHGFLHLLGYDHIEDDEAEEMESTEVRILKTLGVENPYI